MNPVLLAGKDVIFVNECAFSRVYLVHNIHVLGCAIWGNLVYLVVVAGISGMSSPSTVRSGVIRCLSPQRA
jgi:hypothetical protein